MNHLARARTVFDIELAAIKAVRGQLNRAFDDAVELIVGALRDRNKIVVVGVGKSGNIGKKIAATLTSTGSTAVVLNSVDALHGDLGVVADGDVILALSYSGESEEILKLMPHLKRFLVRIVTMTGSAKSALARHSDVVISVKVPKEACPFNLAPTASTTATLVMGDALAMAILQARGFKEKDFARHHPDGSIGRTLLLKTKDIMRSGSMNAVADISLTIKEALMVMIRAQSGSISVVNKSGKLVGVFTDGDLRRHLARDDNALQKRLESVMTPKPICVRDDALAAEALKIFNERKIDDLIVVDSKYRPIGLIDSQDLPKLKLM